MTLTRYIIWVTCLEDKNMVLNTLKVYSDITLSISDTILCIETDLTTAKIRGIVGDDLEMACVEMDDKFIEKIQRKKLKDSERVNLLKFLELTRGITTIDEGLDLISERGGLKYLTDKEIKALDRLTNKPTT